MSRYAKRTDRNHTAITEALRKRGVPYMSTHTAGGGFPDVLAVDRDGRPVFLEIKDSAKPPSARRLTTAELWFAQVFKRCQVYVVGCPKCALMAVGRYHGNTAECCAIGCVSALEYEARP